MHAGFPLTDVQLGRSFAVASAHDPAAINWVEYRGIDTLVLLMSGRALPCILDGLIGAGWPLSTPVRALNPIVFVDYFCRISQCCSLALRIKCRRNLK